MKEYKHGEELRKYWAEQKRKYRAKKKKELENDK
jgi:hypothetical protein